MEGPKGTLRHGLPRKTRHPLEMVILLALLIAVGLPLVKTNRSPVTFVSLRATLTARIQRPVILAKSSVCWLSHEYSNVSSTCQNSAPNCVQPPHFFLLKHHLSLRGFWSKSPCPSYL
ncbi:rCG59605 [Rattus norvegicus]|uniref:RCG59605 n=1 Tax=Rattus norvegicus TaxID=10116 RepID=A6HRY8_RAT|nr:rCG59605 [Rattus norvegicus]